MLKCADRLGPEMVKVSLDFDERVIRMGYGDFQAVAFLRDAGIAVSNPSGLRTSLVIVENRGCLFTLTPLYLEAEAKTQQGHARMQEAVCYSLAGTPCTS